MVFDWSNRAGGPIDFKGVEFAPMVGKRLPVESNIEVMTIGDYRGYSERLPSQERIKKLVDLQLEHFRLLGFIAIDAVPDVSGFRADLFVVRV